MSSQDVLTLPRIEAPGLDQAFLAARQWETIPAIQLVRGEDGAAALLPTEVRAAWSSRGVHVRFTCTDPTPLGQDLTRDAPLMDAEAVGVFLDPRGERSQYMAILATPYGRVADARVESPLHHGLAHEVDNTWDCPGVRVRGWGQQTQWSVEMLIPFTGITPAIDLPVAGTRWTGNFYRIERRPVLEISAWQPTHSSPPDLHASAYFGVLAFG